MVELAPHNPAALPLAQELEVVLENEYQALQKQDLPAFEALQVGKNQLLTQLTQLCPEPEALKNNPHWVDFIDCMRRCRDAHQRNAIIIDRKLNAIRGAIQSLRGGTITNSVEVYDRLGKLARTARGRSYRDA